MPITDSYKLFVDYFSNRSFSEDQFIQWGLDHIIFVNKDIAEKEWEIIKQNWNNNQDLWIRNSGRNGQSSKLYTDFFALFNKTVKFDATNNNKPTAAIQRALNKVKYKSGHTENSRKDILQNYQVSHIWGHTKNPLLFISPWNICFVPKMFDPFTGHEAKGPLVKKFQLSFIEKAKILYADLINDYNNFINREILQTGLIDQYIHTIESEYKNGKIPKKTFEDFQKNIKEEFSLL